MPKDRYEQFTMGADGKPTLKVHRYDGTGDETYTGDKALAWASNPYSERWRRVNPILARANRIEKGDVRGSIPYRLGTWVKSTADTPGSSMFGSLFDGGMKQGGIAGALVGGLGALGTRYIYNKFFGDGKSDPNYLLYTLLGAAGGGALGAGLGHLRSNAIANGTSQMGEGSLAKFYETNGRYDFKAPNETSVNMYKTASIYKNPKNYIMEKIQTTKDLTPAGKVKLCNAVIQLDDARAEKLSKVVREALGRNTGAAIVRFLYGIDSCADMGSYFSRMLSLFGKVYMDRVGI